MTRQPGFLPGHAPLLLITSALLALACGEDDPAAPVTFLLGPGQELDALSLPPAPAEVTLLGVKDGAASTLLRSALPAERLALDALPSEGTWTFRAELRDATGTLLLRGQTPPLSSGLLAGSTVPIHCGRIGAFSRPSAGLSAGWRRPALALALDRYLLVAGESVEEGAPTELYDLAALLPLVASAPLPRAPRTAAASRSGRVLLIDDKGATILDLSTGSVVEVTAELAGDASGGQVIDDGDGGTFVVGATRAEGDLTGTVLHLDRQGTLVRLALQQPRRGAAAAWVEGAGLVVAGGDAEASVEVLPPGSSAFVATGLLLPAVAGAALAPLSASELVLLGGVIKDPSPAPARRLSLACAAGCPAPAPLPFSFEAREGRGYAVGAGKALALGEGATGLVAVLVEATTDEPRFTEIPLRAPRREASSLRLPDGRVVVLGGVDGAGAPVRSVELFTPP
jgi:hypothetical protein